MADYYVSATAGGGGVGTEGDPFTIVEAFAKSDYAVSDKIYIKSGTYTVTATLFASDQQISFIGYDTVIGDQDEIWGDVSTKPIITAGLGAGVVDILDINGKNGVFLYNLRVDGTNSSGINFDWSVNGVCYNCVSKNSSDDGFDTTNAILCLSISDNNAYPVGFCYGSVAISSASIAYNNCHAISCASYNCGNVAGDFFSSGKSIINCTSYGASGIAFYGSNAGTQFINCIAVNAGTYSYSGITFDIPVINCNSFNPGTDHTNGTLTIINLTTLDPALTDPANGDFTLGNTNMYGLGAHIGSLDGTGTLDLGAIQKTAGAGGGAIPTFAGLTSLEPSGFGDLTVYWSAGSGTIDSYNIYARVGSAPTATSDYFVGGTKDSTDTSYTFNHLKGGTRIQDTDKVYVKVQAENAGGLDISDVSEYAYPLGSGVAGVRVMSGGAIPLYN